MANLNDDRKTTGTADSFEAFRLLYEETVLQIASWSEGEVLKPQYMHLHESDIGTEYGYELGAYICAFVDSLGGLRKRLKRIVFCFSYESAGTNDPVCDTSKCTRERFYWYELVVPHDRDLKRSDITWRCGDVATKPSKVADHPHVKQLEEVLMGCHWIQPYMLREVNDGVDVQFELAEVTSQRIKTLIEWHSRPENYQFSIYGFEIGDDPLSEAERLLLNLAFLVHIWTWNHDLRTTHQVRQVALHGLPRGRELWSQLSAEVEALFDRLRNLYVSLDDHTDSLIPLSQSHADELFNEPHDLSMWEARHFPTFLRLAQRDVGSRRLSEFLGYCGWPDVGIEPLTEPEDITTARGCWLATKYLTRCALDTTGEQYRKASFDQILLATLVGLHEAKVRDMPIRVTRSIEIPRNGPWTEEDGLEILQLAYREEKHNWLHRDYDVQTKDEEHVRRVTARWEYSGIKGEYLPAFLRSGMLAMQMVRPSLHVFRLPMNLRNSDHIAVSGFLLVVCRLARALGRQLLETSPLAKPIMVRADLRTRRDAGGGCFHRASILFELDRVLPAIATLGSGRLSGPLTRLAEWCGAGAPVRVDGLVDSDAWNCFVVTRDERCEVLLTFGEGESS